jgi:hypothetical protein
MRWVELNGWRTRFFLHRLAGMNELSGHILTEVCALLYVGR